MMVSNIDKKPDGMHELIWASLRGSYHDVQALVDQRNINVCNEKGYTPVMIAIERGNVELASFLLIKGADLNVKGQDEKTPLMLAAASGRNFFLESKVFLEKLRADAIDLNAQDAYGQTALMWAIHHKNYHFVKMLLNEKKDSVLNFENKEGTTPIMFALLSDASEEILDLLIESGAKLRANDKERLCDKTPSQRKKIFRTYVEFRRICLSFVPNLNAGRFNLEKFIEKNEDLLKNKKPRNFEEKVKAYKEIRWKKSLTNKILSLFLGPFRFFYKFFLANKNSSFSHQGEKLTSLDLQSSAPDESLMEWPETDKAEKSPAFSSTLSQTSAPQASAPDESLIDALDGKGNEFLEQGSSDSPPPYDGKGNEPPSYDESLEQGSSDSPPPYKL